MMHLPHGFCADLILNPNSASYWLCHMNTLFYFPEPQFPVYLENKHRDTSQFALRIKCDNVCAALAIAPDT